MKALTNLARRVKELSIERCLFQLAKNKQFTDLIIELNTRKQLYDKGVDSKNKRLDDGRRLNNGGYFDDMGVDGYSNVTIYGDPKQNITGKLSKGQPIDRITLYDSGDFYKSFKVYLKGTDFIISADTIKDSSDLISDWGKEILGLTEESLIILRENAIKILIPYVKSVILQR